MYLLDPVGTVCGFLALLKAPHKPRQSKPIVKPADLVNSLQILIKSNKIRTTETEKSSKVFG